MRWLFPLAGLSLALGCASGTSSQRPLTYDPGVAPQRFDLEVRMRAPGSYDVAGTPHSFAELSALVSRRGAAAVLVREASSVADVLCLAMLGIETGSSVFFASDTGEPRAVTWSGDAEDTANVTKGCRQ